VYFFPFGGKCITCEDQLQGRIIVSWKGILHCPDCSIKVGLVVEKDLVEALDKMQGCEESLQDFILRRMT